MAIKERFSGNEAVANALRQVNPDVMAAFPITPSTEIPQYFSSFVADGKVDTVFVPVESEHSAMSACIGSEASGARTVTATSSAGLALMWEELYVASSDRLPIVLALVNRALTGPININCDHSDSMGARDAGWIQLYSENNQEAYDNMIQAFRIAEHPDVLLPAMVCQDGFITSHAVENIELLEDEKVKAFVGEYTPDNSLLNPKTPLALGPYATSAYYIEHKRKQAQGMFNAKNVILDVAAQFEALSGRQYGLFEAYKLEDAEYAMVIIGSAAGTGKDAVDMLRAKGIKAGLLKVRVFRPFPAEEIAKALSGCKAVALMDRAESFSGNGGPLAAEVCAALFRAGVSPAVSQYVYGLGGRDVKVEDLLLVFEALRDTGKNGADKEAYRYLSVREEV